MPQISEARVVTPGSVLFGLFGCIFGLVAAAPVRVVTTIPDLADWVRNVGGKRVEVQSLLRGAENPHTFEPGPDDARAVAQADLLVRVGRGLEDWFGGLVANAGNRRLRVLTVAEVVDVTETSDVSGRVRRNLELVSDDSGHQHGHGNPHIWLDPENAKGACDRIATELGWIDPAGAREFRTNAEQYSRRLDALTDTLQRSVQNLADRRFISYHDAWPYFARRFGFEVAASIEPLPGQEPSARHLANLVELVRQESIRVVVSEPQLPREVPEALAMETGARLVILAPVTGSLPEAVTYYRLLRYIVRTLVSALSN